jgi:hypothetical protein
LFHLRFGFNCRFEHQPNYAHQAGIDELAQQTSLLTVDDVPAFQARDAHSASSDLILFPRKSLLPSQAQRILLNASQDGVRLESPQKVYELGEVLMAGREQSESFTNEDRILQLARIAQNPGNLLLRLGEILRYGNVIYDFISTGPLPPSSLSFQRGYLPFFAASDNFDHAYRTRSASS